MAIGSSGNENINSSGVDRAAESVRQQHRTDNPASAPGHRRYIHRRYNQRPGSLNLIKQARAVQTQETTLGHDDPNNGYGR